MRGIRAAGVLLACLLTLVVPRAAFAHPLGNFTINRYARLELQPRQLRVYYVLDMAEIPTYQDVALIHAGPGLPTDAERRAYLASAVSRLIAGIAADADGQPLQLAIEPGTSEISYPAGQGGLPTTRIVAWLRAPLPVAPTGASVHLTFADRNYQDRVGWKEVVVRPLAGVRVDQSTAAAVDQSDELRSYPQDMLSSPLDVRGAQVAYTAVPALGAESPLMVQARGRTGGWLQAATDAFTGLVSRPSLSFRFILFALLAAAALGGIHALSPGHGKTVVAAYLVGARGTPRHALILGLTVTITHTAGVFALGLVTLFASRFILPERLYPWLSVASGVMVSALGAWLFVARVRAAARQAGARGHGTVASIDDDDAEHAPRAAASAAASATAGRVFLPADGVGRWVPATADLAPNGGALPVRAVIEHTHDHPHVADRAFLHARGSAHAHVHEGHGHDHTHPAPGERTPRRGLERTAREHEHRGYAREGGHAHTREEGVIGHDHGTGWHTHAVPPTGPVGLRGLVALGVSGGLLPCPSALVVLLASVSLQRVGFGIVLVLAFSLGLAAVLTGIGLLLVYARGVVARYRLEYGAGRFLPAASALVVLGLGLAITAQALVQAGLAPALGA